ncbi:MAG: hypothetical protein L6R40_003794 [Gallowayella cf. fulva]|nr:MAG: hypothetical protein L6R40_003794 [Xanthomendoza cf. fulva]
MGGKAFSHGPEPLLTPRMPPAVYLPLLERYRVDLASFFERVASPIEAPEKTSFGDIDFLVSQPKTAPFQIESVGGALNAKRILSFPPLYSLAVPYPDLEGSFVQLDVHVCKHQHFDWELFHRSHGDLWNLLGSSIRHFGLTANDTGLHLRIPEIEPKNRKRAMICLTADPNEVLDFLRLDKTAYQQPFDTVEHMYEYACSSIFFWPEAYVKGDLKANDRKRMVQRDLYRRFVEEFVPNRQSAVPHRDDAARPLREEVFEEALERFGKGEELVTRLRKWRKEQEELNHKHATREWRKEQALETDAYADAWINSSKSRSTAGSLKPKKGIE